MFFIDQVASSVNGFSFLILNHCFNLLKRQYEELSSGWNFVPVFDPVRINGWGTTVEFKFPSVRVPILRHKDAAIWGAERHMTAKYSEECDVTKSVSVEECWTEHYN